MLAAIAEGRAARGMLPIDTLQILEEERGVPVRVDRAERMDWAPVRASVKQHGMRNSNVMAIAPTATAGSIATAAPTVASAARSATST